MDNKFINENKFNEAIEHFQHLAEYKYPKQSLKNLYEYIFEAPLEEAGDNNQQQPQDQGGQDMNQGQADGGMPQDGNVIPPPAEGGDNGMGGQAQPDASGMPQDGNAVPPPAEGGDMGGGMPMDGGDMGQQPMDGGDMGQQPMDGEAPMGDEMGAPEEDIETTEMEGDGEEDEVIDVDDLTQSQEATEYKLDGVDDRLAKIYKFVEKFADKLDHTEQSIKDLKQEFERRNPTQTQKFDLRSQAGGPFNQSASDYWDKLVKENPNYEIIRDNDVSPADELKKYEITKDDIDGLNMKSISDTLNMDQDLKKYIGF